ncbi:MAG TPA: Ig-like domain-containing protein [Acidimicrobiales bacterium]|nr:Ig-like domain-containing protein [Acidimicrobiales bacterium]
MSATSKVVLAAGTLMVGGLLAVAVVAGLAATRGPGKQAHGPATSLASRRGDGPGTTAASTTTTSRAQALEHLLSLVTLSPPDGARNQSLKTVVTVHANGAHLVRVRVEASPAGTALLGRLLPTADEWRSTGALLPGATYTVLYVVDANGLTATGSGIFRTSPPARAVTASVFPSSGIVVGVGQPIVFTFSQPVDSYAAQQAVLSHLRLSMSKPVPGGWHWFSSVELHFRPTSFWPVGEQVSVSGDLNGWEVGGGAGGEGQVSTEFVVGDRHISIVNLATHEMTVTDNGSVVYDWPVSAGAPRWPTMDGTHIVLDRESVVHMVSSTVGIPVRSPAGYDEYVYWDVHISDSGEYVHAAPWSVSDQGFINVSHGCVNLSAARAETFFRFSRVGDVVEIVDGPRPPLQGDHGVMDWSFGPSDVVWSPAEVTLLTSSVITIPTTTLPPPAGAPSFATTLPPSAQATTPTATTAPQTVTATDSSTTQAVPPATPATHSTTTVPTTTTTVPPTTRATTTTVRPTTTAQPTTTTTKATTTTTAIPTTTVVATSSSSTTATTVPAALPSTTTTTAATSTTVPTSSSTTTTA